MESLTHSKKVLAALTVITILSASGAQAANVVLDFEGLGDLASVHDYYNGGTDKHGNAGKAHGVTFSETAHGIIDSDVNFYFHGNFANEPSGNTALIFRDGGMATMNVVKGFKSTFSLFFSAAAPVTISVFDGLDGTGSQLATLTRRANVFFDHQCTGDKNGDFCNWDHMSLKFDGVAKSVIFGGSAETAYFDDIKLGSTSTDPNPTHAPIPGALWLMGSALLGLFKIRRKKPF